MILFLITSILFVLIISIIGGFIGGLAFGYVLGKKFEKHLKEIYLKD